MSSPRYLVTVTVNSKVYPLEAVYMSAYKLLETGFFMLDGDPDHEILVSIRSRDESRLRSARLADEFLNELINAATYIMFSKRSRGVKEILLQKALLSNMLPPPERINGTPTDHEQRPDTQNPTRTQTQTQ